MLLLEVRSHKKIDVLAQKFPTPSSPCNLSHAVQMQSGDANIAPRDKMPFVNRMRLAKGVFRIVCSVTCERFLYLFSIGTIFTGCHETCLHE